MKSGGERGGNADSNNRDHCQNLSEPLSIQAGRNKVCGRVCRRTQHSPAAYSLPLNVCVCFLWCFIVKRYRKHVIALHVLSVLVFALVVKLPEEVKGQNSVEVHNHSQQPHSQDQLECY